MHHISPQGELKEPLPDQNTFQIAETRIPRFGGRHRFGAFMFCCMASTVLVTASNLTSPKSISDSISWKIGPQTGISRLPCANGPDFWKAITASSSLSYDLKTVFSLVR